MSGAARRRHVRDEDLSDSSSQRSQLQIPLAFDGPASRGGSSAPPGSGSGRRPSNAGSNQPSRAASNAGSNIGSNIGPRSPGRSPTVSPRMGQGGFASMGPGSGPPSTQSASVTRGIRQDPALDVQRRMTDICRNVDLPAWAYNLDHLVSHFFHLLALSDFANFVISAPQQSPNLLSLRIDPSFFTQCTSSRECSRKMHHSNLPPVFSEIPITPARHRSPFFDELFITVLSSLILPKAPSL